MQNQMHDIIGSVRRSLVFRTAGDGGGGSGGEDGTLVDRINSCIRKSIVFSRPSPPRLPQTNGVGDSTSIVSPPIRWRKGELIGCGAFGQVYMGMNLDSGELLAVKQVLIPANCASKEKAQVHIRELEEEVKLLKNLSHPNIVRYLGTVRGEETLNILLEFVPGGSISSLLGKFGSFPESVVRMYTKQLLLGLDYLHKNGIMHRDIKGANILVDNKGCIKLADFGASKQVVELATVSGAKSMKGTPYWMAPEVIRQTGHSFSADIWSVGCTVIEMATGKPPWHQQYQEVAAFFYYIGTTKEHPPIPENLSAEAKDFLSKCLQKEPELRLPASELLKHPFVTGEVMNSAVADHSTLMEPSRLPPGENLSNIGAGSEDVCNLGTLDISTEKFTEGKGVWGKNDLDYDLRQRDEKDDLLEGETKFNNILIHDDFAESFNPMCEPCDDWKNNYVLSPELEGKDIKLCMEQKGDRPSCVFESHEDSRNDSSLFEDDEEVTEFKIQAFLDEKAVELKKLQTPLYEEFLNSMNPLCSPNLIEPTPDQSTPRFLKLPPKSRSPSQTPSSVVDAVAEASPGSGSRRASHIGITCNENHQPNSSPQATNGQNGCIGDTQKDHQTSPMDVTEIKKKWKEELDQELERKREMMRQAGVGAKTSSSPKDRAMNRQRERSRFASPGK